MPSTIFAGRTVGNPGVKGCLQLVAARNGQAVSNRSGTVSSWLKRVDEDGPESILRLQSPVNKFPELVRYSVTRLKTLCPSLGKVKIAQLLCRAGLHLSASTVGRIVQRDLPIPAPDELNAASEILVKPTVSTQSNSMTTNRL